MYTRVVGELRMEGGDNLAALACRDDVSVDFGKHLHAVACRRDVWRADECHRYLTDAFHVVYGMETAELAAVGVTLHGDIHRVEMLLVKHYKSGTCAEDWKTGDDGVPDR